MTRKYEIKHEIHRGTSDNNMSYNESQLHIVQCASARCIKLNDRFTCAFVLSPVHLINVFN